jgi:hypothetical protein
MTASDKMVAVGSYAELRRCDLNSYISRVDAVITDHRPMYIVSLVGTVELGGVKEVAVTRGCQPCLRRTSEAPVAGDTVCNVANAAMT